MARSLGHLVTFGAVVSKWGSDAEIKGGLFAKCSCGWEHHYVPRENTAVTILYIGLEHVQAEARKASEAYATD